jgi:hypothetical protein
MDAPPEIQIDAISREAFSKSRTPNPNRRMSAEFLTANHSIVSMGIFIASLTRRCPVRSVSATEMIQMPR